MPPVRPIDSPLDRPVRLGVLISGSGTTLENFTRRIADGRLEAEIPVVIASRDGVSGINRAAEAGLRTEIVPRRDYPNVSSFSRTVFDYLRESEVDLVLMAGFLSLIEVPEDFRDRVMNIHPALIPAFCGQGFYGRRVHEAALQRGVKVSGCTVHFADNEYDHGPIILQRCVPVQDDDTPETLAERVFEAECELYPEAVRLFADGRLLIEDRRVRILAR